MFTEEFIHLQKPPRCKRGKRWLLPRMQILLEGLRWALPHKSEQHLPCWDFPSPNNPVNEVWDISCEKRTNLHSSKYHLRPTISNKKILANYYLCVPPDGFFFFFFPENPVDWDGSFEFKNYQSLWSQAISGNRQSVPQMKNISWT